MTRDRVKRALLADVIAKRKANRLGAEYPSVVEDVFRECFPSVYAWIRRTNQYGWYHQNLIRILQRAESNLVIECVCADLMRRFPTLFLITLHDAIYCCPEDVETVVAGFEREFARRDFPMQLKVA